jgi:YbbR domain-containing protein
VSAAEAVVGHINQKDIRATVSAKDLAPGRYDLSVLVSAPEGVIVKDVSPKVISVEIYNQKKLRP